MSVGAAARLRGCLQRRAGAPSARAALAGGKATLPADVEELPLVGVGSDGAAVAVLEPPPASAAAERAQEELAADLAGSGGGGSASSQRPRGFGRKV